MNYVALPLREGEVERLCLAMPVLRGNPRAVRQWTIRRPAPLPPPEVAQSPEPDRDSEFGDWGKSPVFDSAESWGGDAFGWPGFGGGTDLFTM
jgi:hypothetical protein